MIKKIINELIENFIGEFDNDNCKKKIQERVLDPIVCYLIDKMYPYFIICTIIVFILVFLLTLILFLILKR